MNKKRRNKKIKVRRFWDINPKTKVKKSNKLYIRPKKKKELKDILKDYL